MIIQANKAPALSRISGFGLGRLAFVIGAAWALSGAVPTPARADATGWRQACTFKSSPQGYGDMAKERVCIVENYCQKMADAQGSPYTGNGCIMVPPMAPAVAQPAPRATYSRH